jgi:hypothetical protein
MRLDERVRARHDAAREHAERQLATSFAGRRSRDRGSGGCFPARRPPGEARRPSRATRLRASPDTSEASA